jgi:CBS domain-containing protein
MVALRGRDDGGAVPVSELRQARDARLAGQSPVAGESAADGESHAEGPPPENQPREDQPSEEHTIEGVARLITHVASVELDASLDRLRDLLVDRGQHCVPVVGDDGRPLGVVTQSDLLRSIGRAADPAAPPDQREPTARELMTPEVFALPVTASVEQAAALMAYEGVEQILVTGMDGKIAGVVRALDVVRGFARSAGYLVDRQE